MPNVINRRRPKLSLQSKLKVLFRTKTKPVIIRTEYNVRISTFLDLSGAGPLLLVGSRGKAGLSVDRRSLRLIDRIGPAITGNADLPCQRSGERHGDFHLSVDSRFRRNGILPLRR